MSSLSTPTYSHLTSSDYDKVYEPAEDTFLMIDALEKDITFINQKKPTIALEVGPGSGLVITFLANNLKHGALCLASDINNHASVCTKETGQENGVNTEVTTDYLVSSFEKRLKNKVDIILFNPPYVVTSSNEVGGYDISASWAGGVDGREVIDKFLPIATKLLSEKGLLYLLVLEQNKPDELVELMRCNYNMHGHTVIQRRAGPEYLSVLRFNFESVT